MMHSDSFTLYKKAFQFTPEKACDFLYKLKTQIMVATLTCAQKVAVPQNVDETSENKINWTSRLYIADM